MENIFYTRFSPPPKPKMRFKEPSLTEQCHKDECDLNKIIARFNRTGDIAVLENLSSRQGFYADVTGSVDSFAALQNKIAEGKTIFEGLPSDIRLKFHNDAAVFWDFVSDPANAEEAAKLGLIEKPIKRDSSLLDRTVTTDTKAVAQVADDKKE